MAALVAGIYKNDVRLMGRALEDKIVEPERALLIPGYNEAKRAAIEAGATGCSISGSGPSIFALSESETAARHIGEAMKAAFAKIGVASTAYVSQVNSQGATVLHRE